MIWLFHHQLKIHLCIIKGGLWRDTTATLLVSDTASMLTNYAKIGTGGTVTNVTGTLPISVINNTTTPAISIADASASVSGVVTTGTQSFAGAKTFTAATIINGGLVVNEDGSSVGTFRVEGNNNISLIQTSPNDDFVGIGRVPGNAFDVQGAVRFRTLTGNSTPTRIIGADATGDINQITLGTGLSISSGTLSATSTGTVTSVSAGSPANGLSVATGTTTPVISMALAGSGTIGVVSAGTQVFSGAKTFEGLIGFQKALQRPYQSVTGSSASITTASTWIVVNHAGTVTLTFPSASASTGTEFHIKTITNNAVNSNANNVVLLAGGSAQAGILSATAGKWATIVSDGSNWVIMQAN
jgi:autotransporter-associated beta strand protein